MLLLLSDDLQFYKNLTYVVSYYVLSWDLLYIKTIQMAQMAHFQGDFFTNFSLFVHFYDILALETFI